MEKKILVPITPSDVNKEVIHRADIWGQRTGAEIRFLHVRSIVNPLDINFSFGGMTADKDYEELEKYLQSQNLKSKYSIAVRTGIIYSQIIEEENSFEPDLIIMAAHSHTAIARLFLGSNTDYTIHHCRCPVFVFKATMEPEGNNIIVPLDYSDVNKRVISIADEWANRTNSQLHFVHVALPPGDAHYSGNYVWIKDNIGNLDERRQFERIKNLSLEEKQKLESYISDFDLKSSYALSIKFGKPYLCVLDLQKELKANMIVMATHSHTLLNRIFVGSNTNYLLHHTNCSMFIYKG
jgi:nucleotide-binding universal stress UspA family protein